MTCQPRKETITVYILFNISETKSNQTMKYGQVIEYNLKNIFLQKSWRNWGRESSSVAPFVLFF